MNIQFYPQELNWANALLADHCGHFLTHFCNACLQADPQNYEILRPAVHIFMIKYPAKPSRLLAEEEDMPRETNSL